MRHFILADNQQITAEGISSLLGKLKICLSITCADDRKTLASELLRRRDAVVIIDYGDFDLRGNSDLFMLRDIHEDSSWLLFSGELNVGSIGIPSLRAHRINAAMKNDSLRQVSEAILATTSARKFYTENAVSVLSTVDRPIETESLTATESAILRCIAFGKTTRIIAAEKNVSFHIVNTHRKNIFRKIGVNNVHDAIRYALRSGIADPGDYYI